MRETPFILRDALPGELWCAEHRPIDEDTDVLVLPQLLSATEIDELLRAPGPNAPPRSHPMLRGTNTGIAAVHDVAESEQHCKLFLHRGGHFVREWPELSDRLVRAMSTQPGFPRSGESTDDLQIRCVELHTYREGGGLLSRGHRDRGSILSMSILLSDTGDTDGGEFLTWSDDGTHAVPHPVMAGDAILFHSEKTHNVATVTRGVRYSMVSELWRGAANTRDRNR
jgi:hypothetical protein